MTARTSLARVHIVAGLRGVPGASIIVPRDQFVDATVGLVCQLENRAASLPKLLTHTHTHAHTHTHTHTDTDTHRNASRRRPPSPNREHVHAAVAERNAFRFEQRSGRSAMTARWHAVGMNNSPPRQALVKQCDGPARLPGADPQLPPDLPLRHDVTPGNRRHDCSTFRYQIHAHPSSGSG